MLTLHFAPKSRALRAAWMLEELGLDYTLVRYDLTDPALRSPAYRALHPMGRVPLLEDGGVRVMESGAILEYLSARHGGGRLRPAVESAAFPAYLQWLHYAEGMLMPPVNAYMVETFFLPPERQSEEHAGRAKRLLGRMLSPVEAALSEAAYLAGAFSMADIMTGSAVMSAQMVGVPFDDLPHLRAYVARLQGRAAYQVAAAL